MLGPSVKQLVLRAFFDLATSLIHSELILYDGKARELIDAKIYPLASRRPTREVFIQGETTLREHGVFPIPGINTSGYCSHLKPLSVRAKRMG